MYQEHILDLYKHPHNFGKMEGATNQHREYNPLCGDDVTIQMKLEDGKVSSVKFSGRGCAISMASASLITDKIRGMEKDEIMQLGGEDALQMLGIPIGPVRIKCALLALETVHKALVKDNGNT